PVDEGGPGGWINADIVRLDRCSGGTIIASPISIHIVIRFKNMVVGRPDCIDAASCRYNSVIENDVIRDGRIIPAIGNYDSPVCVLEDEIRVHRDIADVTRYLNTAAA